MNYRICLVLILAMASIRSAAADEPTLKIEQGKTSLHVVGKYLDVEVSLSQPQFLRLAVDSLGQGRFQPSALRPPPAAPRPTVARRSGAKSGVHARRGFGRPAAVDVRVRRKEDHDGFAVVRVRSAGAGRLGFRSIAVPRDAVGSGRCRRGRGLARPVALARSGDILHHVGGQSVGAAALRRPPRGRALCQGDVSAGHERGAAHRVSLGGHGDIPEVRRRRKRRSFPRISPRLAEYLSGQPAARHAGEQLGERHLCVFAPINMPTSPCTRPPWPIGSARWIWFAKCWTATSPAGRVTGCRAMRASTRKGSRAATRCFSTFTRPC